MSLRQFECNIERMTENDLEQIIAIEKETFKQPWQRSFFEYDLQQPSRYCLVAKQNNIVLGYANIWHFADELQLANIAVKKEYRKQGIGTFFLQEIINIAKEKRCRSIILEVRISNTAAQYLYEKFGFRSIFIRKQYYPDGEEALVYKKSLE